MENKPRELIVVLFIAALLALNYPLVSLFDRLLQPFGIPLLYLHLFLGWLVVIVLLALIMERPPRERD